LLSNACKYTERGGRIELRIEREENGAAVRVRDNGRGIPPDQIARVFDMFVQIESPVGRGGGVGVGLSLVRSLIELHGGSVEAHSAGLDQGSEFTLPLPLRLA